ncbi:MAG: DUF4198 domain-containing protein [Planctomycetes bacterium]|nr:DUF4198 domain-containing protein [Planctomycetota bacterium]
MTPTALSLLLAALPLFPHFPIAVPEAVFLKRGQTTRVVYGFGHPFEATRVAVARPKVWLYPPKGQRHALTPKATTFQEVQAWAMDLTPKERGDHLLVIEGQPVLHGRETLRDLVKVVIPVGGVERGWDRSLGLDLEIVPLTRPYGLTPGASFRFLVLAKGKPVPGLTVQVERLNAVPPKSLPPEPFRTGAEKLNPQGAGSATLSARGWWILAVEGPSQGGTRLRASLWVYVGKP